MKLTSPFSIWSKLQPQPQPQHKPTYNLRKLSPHNHEYQDLLAALAFHISSLTLSQHADVFSAIGKEIQNTMGRYTWCITTEQHIMHRYAEILDKLIFDGRLKDKCKILWKDVAGEHRTGAVFGEVITGKLGKTGEHGVQILFYVDLKRKESLTSQGHAEFRRSFLTNLLVGMGLGFLRVYGCEDECCDGEMERLLSNGEWKDFCKQLEGLMERDFGIRLDLVGQEEGFVKVGKGVDLIKYGARRFY